MPNNAEKAADRVPDYSSFAAAFNLADITELLAGDLEAGLNVCFECCDRHADADRIALYWEGADGASSTHSFAELRDGAARFASLLTAEGVRPGDQVACMLPRIPELFITALGVWRAGAVYVPLFTAFGPKAIEYRLQRSAARLVVTDAANRAKLDDIVDAPPAMVVTLQADEAVRAGDIDLAAPSPNSRPISRRSCAAPWTRSS